LRVGVSAPSSLRGTIRDGVRFFFFLWLVVDPYVRRGNRIQTLPKCGTTQEYGYLEREHPLNKWSNVYVSSKQSLTLLLTFERHFYSIDPPDQACYLATKLPS